MSKRFERWRSPRLGRDLTLVRWGDVGMPLLLFPTAGGDAEEHERHGVLQTLGPFMADGRVKVYCVDNVASRAWLAEDQSIGFAGWIHQRFDDALIHEVVPAIRADCGHPANFEMLAAGASLGAFLSAAAVCRHPDLFRAALCMSGTFDLTRFLHGEHTEDMHHVSPLHFLPSMPEDSPVLARLRQRFLLLAYGGGRWENGAQNWAFAEVLGRRGVPNRVDVWGPEWDHDWPTWRHMLPQYLDELLRR